MSLRARIRCRSRQASSTPCGPFNLPGTTDPSLVFPERLVDVAVIASQTAAATSRLEIYQRGLDPARALRLAAGALYGVTEITPEEVADRVAARFPEAARLPGRPELDALLRAPACRSAGTRRPRATRGGSLRRAG